MLQSIKLKCETTQRKNATKAFEAKPLTPPVTDASEVVEGLVGARFVVDMVVGIVVGPIVGVKSVGAAVVEVVAASVELESVVGASVGVVVGVVSGVVVVVSFEGSVGASVELESQSKFSATKPFLLIKLAKYRAEFFGTLGRSGSVKSM